MKEHRNHTALTALLRRAAALALAAALVLSLAGCQDLLAALQQAQQPAASTAQPVQPAEGGGFSIDFIDVGQALSVLVTCDGQSMLYDGGNVEDGSLVVSYLQNKGVTRLEYVFQLHPAAGADPRGAGGRHRLAAGQRHRSAAGPGGAV